MGYELNNTSHFVIKQSMTNILYEYPATFNYRSQWAYKTRSNCSGYSIRRGNWQTLLKMNESISIQLTA